MDGDQHADWDAWHRWWGPIANPGPDIVVAMPVDCSLHLSVPRREEASFVVTQGVHSTVHYVEWIGWQPGMGLVQTYGSWRPRDGRAVPPTQGWVAWRRRRTLGQHLVEHMAHNGFSVMTSLYGLPFVENSGQADVLSHDQANECFKQSLGRFLAALPPGMADCMALVENHDAREPLPPNTFMMFHPEYVDMALWYMDHLLGAQSSGEPLWADGVAETVEAADSGVDTELRGFRRREFLQTWPVFAPLLWKALSSVVDSGGNTTQAICRHMNASPRVIRMLGRIGVARVPYVHQFLCTDWCMPLLDGIAPSLLPHLETMSTAAWDGLAALGRAMNPFPGRVLGGRRYLDINAVADLDDPGYLQARRVGAGLAAVGGSMEWLADTAATWAHLYDMVEDMATELALPALLYPGLVNTRPDGPARMPHYQVKAALLCLPAHRLARVLEAHLARLLHAGVPAVDVIAQGNAPPALEDALEDGDQSPSEDTVNGWGHACAQVNAPSGLVLRPLSNQPELLAEGAAMGHCVGSYGLACRQRTSLIVSLGQWVVGDAGDSGAQADTGIDGVATSSVWRPSSTMEIRMANCAGGHKVSIHQHRGHRNCVPPQADQLAAQWWIDQVRDGQLKLAADSLRMAAPERERRAGYDAMTLHVRLGRDWHTPGAHALRWRRWRALLDTRAPCFGDWLLGLPPLFLEAIHGAGELAEACVDMDLAMAANPVHPAHMPRPLPITAAPVQA